MDIFFDAVEATSLLVKLSIGFANALIVKSTNNESIASITTEAAAIECSQIVIFKVADTFVPIIVENQVQIVVTEAYVFSDVKDS